MNKDWNCIKGIKISTSNKMNIDNVIKQKLYINTSQFNKNSLNIENMDININTVITYEFSKLKKHHVFINNNNCSWNLL